MICVTKKENLTAILLAYLHTCILAYLHTCILAYLHTCILAYLHTCILAYLHTCILAYLHTCILAYLHTCILAYLHTCILAYLHTCILAYLHIYLGPKCIAVSMILFICYNQLQCLSVNFGLTGEYGELSCNDFTLRHWCYSLPLLYIMYKLIQKQFSSSNQN